MHALNQGAIVPPKPKSVMQGSGPVVIWNLIRRCNLTCKHCYATSADIDFPGELDTEEVYAVMDDLKAFGVSVLILSGGEPLLRPDIFDISRRAKEMGFYVGLSSNGTLITEDNIAAIDAIGYDCQPRRHARHPRLLPPQTGRFRRVHARHPPLPRNRHQGRLALYPDPGQRR
jgi:uncharacterized radical SAM superfamily Fe-S cluster-containing enzyme